MRAPRPAVQSSFWRRLKKKPLLPIKDEKIESPKVLYFGLLLFGGFSLASFLKDKLYYGFAILIIFIVCLIGLIAHNKGKI